MYRDNGEVNIPQHLVMRAEQSPERQASIAGDSTQGSSIADAAAVLSFMGRQRRNLQMEDSYLASDGRKSKASAASGMMIGKSKLLSAEPRC